VYTYAWATYWTDAIHGQMGPATTAMLDTPYLVRKAIAVWLFTFPNAPSLADPETCVHVP